MRTYYQRVVSKLILVLLLLSSLTCFNEAHAAKKIALVIGTDAYAELPKLKKAVNDARSISSALEDIGFTVIKGENLSRRQMNRSFVDLERSISPGDQVFFFFAGHGVAIGATNYLIPADMPLPEPGEDGLVKGEAFAVDAIVERIQQRGAAASFVVLDACRNNPFKTRGVRAIGTSRGLADISTPKGVFVLFSAGIGQSALDRLSDDDPNPNSVFTRNLVPLLAKPGLSHVQLAKAVQSKVDKLARTVGHEQQPAYYDQVIGNMFLVEQQAASENSAPTNKGKAPIGSEAGVFYEQVKDSTSMGVLRTFINKYPTSFYATLLKARLKELETRKVTLLKTDESNTIRNSVEPTNNSVSKCDKLAASPNDPDRLAVGIETGQLDVGTALVACRQAYNENPADRRLEAQLARVLLIDEQYEEAFKLNKSAIEKGSVLAMINLAIIYKEGYGRAVSLKDAEKWFRKAAQKRSAYAMAELGSMYRFGSGVEKSYSEAVIWFRKAADLGNVTAMHRLADAYYFGRGVKISYVEAAFWYRKAEKKGDAFAIYSLGYMYENGFGVKQSYSQAFKKYETAADKGSADAMSSLGELYRDGSGVAQSYETSLKWFRLAAERKNVSSMFGLGYMYENGFGLPIDIKQAVIWYEKSAKLGNASAMTNLGVLHRDGNGVVQSNAEALKWFRLASEKEHANGMSSLGYMYENGLGTTADIKQAKIWYEKSAKLGNGNAMYNLGRLHAFGKGTPRKDEKKAANYIFGSLKANMKFSIKEMSTNSKTWPKNFRRELQRKMKAEGFYNGVIDGSFGPETIRAIKKIAQG